MYSNRYWDLSHRLWRLFSCWHSSGNELPRWLLNMALTFGTAFSMGVGILYLWVFPAEKYTAWPHFMMLSFYLFVVISAGMILVSLLDKRRQECTLNMKKVMEKPGEIGYPCMDATDYYHHRALSILSMGIKRRCRRLERLYFYMPTFGIPLG